MRAGISSVVCSLALCLGTLSWQSAKAQDFLNQEWLLDPTNSSVYMQTLKANSIFEVQQFMALEGTVSSSGDASIRIDLASISSGIDIRDTRLRFQLFETFRFRYAQVNAKLDKAKLSPLATQTRLRLPLTFMLVMHGRAQEVQADLWVTRISDSAVAVATVKPIILTADSFGLTANIAKLVDAIGGVPIAAGATITFDLMFGTASQKPALEAARAAREKLGSEAAAAALTVEACETRFTVLSQTGSIRFRTGSASIEQASEVVLNSVADIANRCGALKFGVHGHTDNVGNNRDNLRLSQERAMAVSDYLQKKGVVAARMQAEGFGGERPIKPNDTEAGRADNRRIEFVLRKE